MKKIFALILCISVLLGTLVFPIGVSAKAEYEIWTQSPVITCGLTIDDVRIYKTIQRGELEFYKLSAIGSNYYFVICPHERTDGGYRGNSDTTHFYFYTLYTTADGFVILSKAEVNNEYYWDKGYSFSNISGKANSTYYKNNGSEVPYYILNPKGKYTHSNVTEYDEYFIVSNKGIIYTLTETVQYEGVEGYPYIYNNSMYRGQDYYREGSYTRNYYMSDGSTKASNSKPMFFKNGSITYGSETKVALSNMTTANGYTLYKEGFSSNVSLSTNSAWTGKKLSNVFPDGRYVEDSWSTAGDYIFEFWYEIYNADGTLKSTGASGYAGSYSSSFSTPNLITWAINNTKFIVCTNDISNTFLKEYYRASVVSETDTGEIESKASIGEKKIVPPSTSDTEAVQTTVDFSKTDLPIGYKIKNNAIGSGKLDATLRSQINSIRLNDIVIVAKEGYQSGEQNTGVTLSSYNVSDNSLGNEAVTMYTNGQYFRWYCNYPEDLTEGTYSKAITVGDKTLYVTFKVVAPPTNDGTNTVVF